MSLLKFKETILLVFFIFFCTQNVSSIFVLRILGEDGNIDEKLTELIPKKDFDEKTLKSDIIFQSLEPFCSVIGKWLFDISELIFEKVAPEIIKPNLFAWIICIPTKENFYCYIRILAYDQKYAIKTKTGFREVVARDLLKTPLDRKHFLELAIFNHKRKPSIRPDAKSLLQLHTSVFNSPKISGPLLSMVCNLNDKTCPKQSFNLDPMPIPLDLDIEQLRASLPRRAQRLIKASDEQLVDTASQCSFLASIDLASIYNGIKSAAILASKINDPLAFNQMKMELIEKGKEILPIFQLLFKKSLEAETDFSIIFYFYKNPEKEELLCSCKKIKLIDEDRTLMFQEWKTESKIITAPIRAQDIFSRSIANRQLYEQIIGSFILVVVRKSSQYRYSNISCGLFQKDLSAYSKLIDNALEYLLEKSNPELPISLKKAIEDEYSSFWVKKREKIDLEIGQAVSTEQSTRSSIKARENEAFEKFKTEFYTGPKVAIKKPESKCLGKTETTDSFLGKEFSERSIIDTEEKIKWSELIEVSSLERCEALKKTLERQDLKRKHLDQELCLSACNKIVRSAREKLATIEHLKKGIKIDSKSILKQIEEITKVVEKIDLVMSKASKRYKSFGQRLEAITIFEQELNKLQPNEVIKLLCKISLSINTTTEATAREELVVQEQEARELLALNRPKPLPRVSLSSSSDVTTSCPTTTNPEISSDCLSDSSETTPASEPGKIEISLPPQEDKPIEKKSSFAQSEHSFIRCQKAMCKAFEQLKEIDNILIDRKILTDTMSCIISKIRATIETMSDLFNKGLLEDFYEEEQKLEKLNPESLIEFLRLPKKSGTQVQASKTQRSRAITDIPKVAPASFTADYLPEKVYQRPFFQLIPEIRQSFWHGCYEVSAINWITILGIKNQEELDSIANLQFTKERWKSLKTKSFSIYKQNAPIYFTKILYENGHSRYFVSYTTGFYSTTGNLGFLLVNGKPITDEKTLSIIIEIIKQSSPKLFCQIEE